MNEPLVSIIIPTYNRENLISETIESVLSQTYTNWECIIIDDNSTDGTEKLLESYSNNDKRIRYLVKPEYLRKGASVSRNLGLKMAKGEFIQFLDSDDFLAPNKIEVQLDLLSKESEYVITTCKWGNFSSLSESFKIIETNFDYRDFYDTKNYFELIGLYGGFFPPLTFLVNKKLVDFSGHWNESLTINDDGEFFFRIISNAHKMLFTDKTYVLYRNNIFDNLSILNSEIKANSLLNSWRIIEALYIAKYNEVDSSYINKKKNSVYCELKGKYPEILKKNRDFFKLQIKNDTLFLRLTKLKKRIKNRLRLISR